MSRTRRPDAETPLREKDSSPSDTPLGRGVPLGRWFDIPVVAHWSVLLAVALFAALIATVELPGRLPGLSVWSYWATAAVLAPLFLVTLLAHEFAHAVTARHYRLGVRRITVWMLGGLTELEGEAPTPRADALIAASGPLTSLGLAAVCALAAWLTPDGTLARAALGWLASINLLLAVFNLLPGAPLDGGRLLRAALWWRSHDRAVAAARAARAGRVLGMVLIWLGLLQALGGGGYLGLWTALIGWFILGAATNERYSVRAEALAGLTVADAMTPTPVVLPDWSTVADFFARVTPDTARQSVFPLADLDGRSSGAVTFAMLSTVAPARAGSVRLRELTPHRPLMTTTPTQELGTLLLPLHLRGGLAIVVDDGRPVGVVTDADLQRAAVLAGSRGSTTS
jgi:Zn-dependent protease